MLLDNFDKACKHVTCTSCNGGSGYFDINYSPSSGTHYTSTNGGWYVDVGLSNTIETFSEYKLDNSCFMDNSNLLTWVSSTVTNTQPYIKCVTSTYTNNSENDVIIKEIGIVGKSAGSATASAISYNFLFARKVLDTPITIHSGESYSFTYSISI